MHNHKTFIEQMEIFQKEIPKHWQLKQITMLNEIKTVIDHINYIDGVSRAELKYTLVNYKNWQNRASELYALTQEEKEKTIEAPLENLKTVLYESHPVALARKAETEHYYFSVSLQMFFNNEENWKTWKKQLKDEKLKKLQFLKQKWFSQHNFAIAPAKVLLIVQKRLDLIKMYLSNLRMEFKLNYHLTNHPFFKSVSQHIVELEQYIESVEKQITASAVLRLEAGLAVKNPARDNVVNYFKQNLKVLGITTSTMHNTETMNDAIKEINKIHSFKINPTSRIEKGKRYSLDDFQLEEIHRLDSKQFNALHVLAVPHANYSYAVKGKLQTNTNNRGIKLIKPEKSNTPLLYCPQGISVPAIRPRFFKLFSTETFKYDFLQEQQLLLTTQLYMEEKNFEIITLSFSSDFSKSREKLLFDEINDLRNSLVMQIKIIATKKDYNIFSPRRLFYLYQWKSFYESQLQWTNSLLKNWFKKVVSPQIKHLALNVGDIEKQKIYYKNILHLLQDTTLSNLFTVAEKKDLSLKINKKINTKTSLEKFEEALKETVRIIEETDNIVFLQQAAEKKEFSINEIQRLQELTPLICKGKENLQEHSHTIKNLFCYSKTLIINANNYIKDQGVVPTDIFKLLHKILAILVEIKNRADCFGVNYEKSTNSVLQKLLHLYINALATFNCQHAVPLAIRNILDTAEEKLGNNTISDYRTVDINESLNEVNLYERIQKRLVKKSSEIEETQDQKSKNEFLIYNNQQLYQEALSTCKKNQDETILRKNLKKMFLKTDKEGKNQIEQEIHRYLIYDLKLGYDYIEVFNSLKQNQEDIIKNRVIDTKQNYLILRCPTITELINLSSYADEYKVKLSYSDMQPTRNELRNMFDKTRVLLDRAFPKIYYTQSSTNNFFYRKFSMATLAIINTNNNEESNYVFK